MATPKEALATHLRQHPSHKALVMGFEDGVKREWLVMPVRFDDKEQTVYVDVIELRKF